MLSVISRSLCKWAVAAHLLYWPMPAVCMQHVKQGEPGTSAVQPDVHVWMGFVGIGLRHDYFEPLQAYCIIGPWC
jgi:hypothetical protein